MTISNQPTTMSGGQSLIRELLYHGCDTGFCVPGESYLGALDGIYSLQDQFKLITCRQEGGAAYMAEAWGKLKGTPGICFVSRGPGASNAMVGIHTAFQDSTPLICFIGQVSRADRGREAFQELDYSLVYGSVAKKVIEIDDASRIPEQINHAYQVATSGRPGPVMVVLYEDMLKDMVTPKEHPEKRETFPAAPDIAAIEEAKKLLAAAQRPLIICGDSSWNCRTSELLQALSETCQIPVATAFRRQDNFDNTHPHYIGEFGLVAPQTLSQYLKDADLLLVIGPRLGEIATQGYQRLEPPYGFPSQKLIHVHPEGEQLNAVYHADLAIVSDSTSFLSALQETKPTANNRSQVIEPLRKGYIQFVEEPRFTDDAVRMDIICKYLRDRLPSNAIITIGAGNYTTWAQRHYQYQLVKTQLGSTNGSMGYGVPAAVAAKVAHPDIPVVSFSGDGCFLMNGQELATAVQYGLNPIFLIINNSRYGTIRSHQERHYPDRVVGTSLQNPDFAALAEAYGAAGFIVKQTAEFEEVFERALKSIKPAVIELLVYD